ncbi:hypothetical protein niasHS_001146 [Heterodera schachtii]|uniref:Gland protein n=1 Tax=Heterodera schachtii TaxID=97005 RepID=A0ABD2KCC2_HETSC
MGADVVTWPTARIWSSAQVAMTPNADVALEGRQLWTNGSWPSGFSNSRMLPAQNCRRDIATKQQHAVASQIRSKIEEDQMGRSPPDGCAEKTTRNNLPFQPCQTQKGLCTQPDCDIDESYICYDGTTQKIVWRKKDQDPILIITYSFLSKISYGEGASPKTPRSRRRWGSTSLKEWHRLLLQKGHPKTPIPVAKGC